MTMLKLPMTGGLESKGATKRCLPKKNTKEKTHITMHIKHHCRHHLLHFRVVATMHRGVRELKETPHARNAPSVGAITTTRNINLDATRDGFVFSFVTA